MRKFLIIILLFVSSLYSQVVVDIEVKGNKLVDKSLITAASGLAVGKEFTSGNARDAIKKLYALGLLRDVTIDSERKGSGVKVIIQVEEYPRVSMVEFIGNKKINDKKLSEVCGIKQGDIASDRHIFDGKVNILKEYRDKGHFLVEVEPKTEMTEDGMIIRFFITEKVNLKIREIEIIENKAFPDEAIERAMQNREKTWYRKAIFNSDKFEEDKERIKQFYAERGFPNAEIKNIEFIQLDENWVKIEITIEEGKKLYFGDISFLGNKIIPNERLHKYIKFKKGSIYNVKELQESVQNLYETYGDLGYLYLNVNVEEELSDSIVNITYNIREGNPARVNYIWVKGNTKTHEKVIRRELTIFPGDILRRNELIRSQRKVYNLGFFSDLKLGTRVVSDSGDMDLTFNVEEKQAGQFSVGIGYSAETKLTGNVSISIPNLRGLGELLYIKGDKGSKYTNYELGFREPWLFDTPLSVGLNIFNLEMEKLNFTERRKGGRIDITRLIPRLAYTSGYISYGMENVFIKADSTAPRSLIEQVGERWKSAITLGLRRDSRDNFMNPREGSKNSISMEISGLGGDVRFQKYIFESHIYNCLSHNFVTLVRSKFGTLSPKSAPTYERFILGGVGAWGIRGYPDLSVGTLEQDRFTGGRYALLFTVESKIAFEQNIYPIVFMDLGNTWNNLEEINLYDLKKGIGFGIRMEIPMMGLLGFDFAHGEQGWMPHFQVGTEF
jgi:outer membrane protein insertion porin family